VALLGLIWVLPILRRWFVLNGLLGPFPAEEGGRGDRLRASSLAFLTVPRAIVS